MIASIHACVDLLHVGYRVKEDYDPIILNVYHCLKVEGLNDEKYMLHIDSVLKKSIHDLDETQICTYITYVFEKEKYVPYFLKSFIEYFDVWIAAKIIIYCTFANCFSEY